MEVKGAQLRHQRDFAQFWLPRVVGFDVPAKSETSLKSIGRAKAGLTHKSSDKAAMDKL